MQVDLMLVCWKVGLLCAVGGIIMWYLGDRWFPELNKQAKCNCYSCKQKR